MLPEACLFLEEWEACRIEVHARRRERAERALAELQLRVRNAAASVCAWRAAAETRRKLAEVASGAAARGVEELEAQWRPQRQDARDGEAAHWLLTAERAQVAALGARAARWATALRGGYGQELVRRLQALDAKLGAEVVSAYKAWDETHQTTLQAWESHGARLQDVARAADAVMTPPDTWLSEVRYREKARAYLVVQHSAEKVLNLAIDALSALEQERAEYWVMFAAAYASAHLADTSRGAMPDMQAFAQLPAAPPLSELPPVLEAIEGRELPSMPSASGAVLRRLQAASQAPAGMFGGNPGWKEGATLVLTLQGYLHLFSMGKPSAQAKTQQETEPGQDDTNEREELVESAIVASVYVPMATRCVFLRRGKDLTLDLAEAEGVEQPQAPQGLNLGRWLRRDTGAGQPVPRRVYARVTNEDEFRDLEARCHEFVRHGQELRAGAKSGMSST